METNINLGTISGTIHHIRRNEYPHGKVASFQLATQYFGRKKDGTPFCETTYHLVTAWESESIRPDLLQEGQTVFVEGRWRNISYEKSGDKIFTYELLVKRMQILTV